MRDIVTDITSRIVFPIIFTCLAVTAIIAPGKAMAYMVTWTKNIKASMRSEMF